MNNILTNEEFLDLLKIRTSEEVETFLSKLDIAESCSNPSGHKFKWYPVGDSLSNAANIEMAQNSIAPIIERITNAFDANIELKNILNPDETLPQSPRKAIEKWFDISDGDMGKHSTTLSNKQRTELASLSKVEFHDSGDIHKPTIVIRDIGTGQHPQDFKATFLRLGESNKISSPHLHGTYGHGGSSTFRFCEYSIIISRPNKEFLNGKEDSIGWTIIRKDTSLQVYSEKDGKVVDIKKPPVYQYLCLESGGIPHISTSDISFDQGTYVAHIAYNARYWYNLSRGPGYKLFRNFLFDPVLPFRLEDLREDFDSFNRNMFGARATLLASGDVAYSNEVEQYFQDGGKLKIRYWVLFDEKNPKKRPLTNYLERENSRNTIILTLNGQRHGTLERSIIARELRLSNLSQCLVVQIEIDELPRQMKSEMFTSGRENMVEEGDTVDLVKSKLKAALEEDEELKEWERRLMIQISKVTDDEGKKAVKNILNKLIKIGISPGLGGPRFVKIEGGTGSALDYKPQDPPTSLKYVTNQEQIELIQGKAKRVNLEINGPDNFLTRRKNKGKLSYKIPTDASVHVTYNSRDLSQGRLPIILTPTINAPVHSPFKIKFILESENLDQVLEAEKALVVVSPPVFEPQDPPTELKFMRIPPIKLYRGKSNAISISMNGPDDIFERQEKKSTFLVEVNHNLVQVERIRMPNEGKMSVSLRVDNNAKVGDSFTITCKLKMYDGTELTDSKEVIIVEPVEKEVKKGGMTEVTLPNYDIQPIYREDWSQFTPAWDETTVGKYDVTRDDDDKDKLILYVNADNENIVGEVNRRIHIGQQATGESIRQKYIAYIGYHLYLMYESENEEEISQSTSEEHESSEEKEMTEEDRQSEYGRVSKTLVLSFQSLSHLPEDED